MTSILECCPPIPSTGVCDLSNSIFQKDVYPPSFYPAPAISSTVLTFVFFGMGVYCVTNFYKIAVNRTKVDLKRYMTMNLFIFVNIVWRFVYMLDGPLQLFSDDSGLSTNAADSLEIVSMCFMNMNFAYASYVWIELILVYKGKWDNKRLANSVKAVFFSDVIFIIGVMIFDVTVLLTDYSQDQSAHVILISVSTIVNGLIFTGTCYMLGVSLLEIYNFDSKMTARVKTVQVLAAIAGFSSLMRIVNDMLAYGLENWQQELNLKSYCDRKFNWSAYILFFTIAIDIMPLILFMILFRPGSHSGTHQEGSSSSSVDSNLFIEKSSSSFGSDREPEKNMQLPGLDNEGWGKKDQTDNFS